MKLSSIVGRKQKKKIELESIEPCKINKIADYIEQLKKELTTTVEEQRLLGMKIPDIESSFPNFIELVKHNEDLTSITSNEEDTNQKALGAYSFGSQIMG